MSVLEAHDWAPYGFVDAQYCPYKVITSNLDDHAWFSGYLGVLRLLVPRMSCKNIATIGISGIQAHRGLPYRLHCPAMDMRAEVWSPVQNVSVWLGAWLWGHESTDDLLDALSELGGEQQGVEGEPFVDVMSLLRRETASVIELGEREPLLRLVLSGPGDAPALPAGTESARAAAENPAGAIVVRTNNRDRNLVLVPTYAVGATRWTVIEETAPLPSPAWLSPGEADELLSTATNESANLIEALGYRSDALPNPRLTV